MIDVSSSARIGEHDLFHFAFWHSKESRARAGDWPEIRADYRQAPELRKRIDRPRRTRRIFPHPACCRPVRRQTCQSPQRVAGSHKRRKIEYPSRSRPRQPRCPQRAPKRHGATQRSLKRNRHGTQLTIWHSLPRFEHWYRARYLARSGLSLRPQPAPPYPRARQYQADASEDMVARRIALNATAAKIFKVAPVS